MLPLRGPGTTRLLSPQSHVPLPEAHRDGHLTKAPRGARDVGAGGWKQRDVQEHRRVGVGGEPVLSSRPRADLSPSYTDPNGPRVNSGPRVASSECPGRERTETRRSPSPGRGAARRVNSRIQRLGARPSPEGRRSLPQEHTGHRGHLLSPRPRGNLLSHALALGWHRGARWCPRSFCRKPRWRVRLWSVLDTSPVPAPRASRAAER